MASRKSVVFTKCSFSFTLREKGKEWGSCPPQPQPPPSTVRALNSCPLPRGTHCPPPPPAATHTWPAHGCSPPGPSSSSRSPRSRRRPSPASERTWGQRTQQQPWPSSSPCATWGSPGAPPSPPSPPPHSLDQLWVAVQLAPVLQPARPGEDAGDGVGAGGPSLRADSPPLSGLPGTPHSGTPQGTAHLLVLPVVPCDGAVCRLRLNGLPVGAHQHRGHQPQRAEAYGGTGSGRDGGTEPRQPQSCQRHLGPGCPTARHRRSSYTPRRSRPRT